VAIKTPSSQKLLSIAVSSLWSSPLHLGYNLDVGVVETGLPPQLSNAFEKRIKITVVYLLFVLSHYIKTLSIIIIIIIETFYTAPSLIMRIIIHYGKPF